MGNKHILVVESDPDDAFLLSRALKAMPFCTSFLCRGLAEARAYLSQSGIFKDTENYPVPSGVITELRLGTDSGYELLNWIRESQSLRGMPLFVLAGAISPTDKETLKSLGIKRVVEKPIDPSEMRRVLREMAEEVCGDC